MWEALAQSGVRQPDSGVHTVISTFVPYLLSQTTPGRLERRNPCFLLRTGNWGWRRIEACSGYEPGTPQKGPALSLPLPTPTGHQARGREAEGTNIKPRYQSPTCPRRAWLWEQREVWASQECAWHPRGGSPHFPDSVDFAAGVPAAALASPRWR